ncbi:NADP-dependent oxidoreductase [uncultured Modestobacter sp.]|uniref:NADP-dependent oxidoreductase n=1 Tax=uncultured Modestobacter sp. TaxID=380048 RepID=UPI0026262583|nr:NADP-dependent oxidoreductase [uncultured Modestobacter sp.]
MPQAVQFDHYGDRDVLQVVDVPMPHPTSGEVLVAVRAAAINPGEAAIRQGAMESVYPATFPSGQGSDLAGVVVEAGTGVEGFAVGDEVFGWTEQRASHAEYVVVPAGQLTHKPAAVSWEAAGSLYVAGVTAWATIQAVGAEAGDTVAVSGATGGVGSITVQLLRARGAQVVGIASEANADWLRGLGVTPVAYGDGLADRLQDAAPGGIDAFIDTFGGGYVQLAVDLGVSRERIDTIIDFGAAQELGVQAKGGGEVASPAVLDELAQAIVAGQVAVPIAASYPLEQVRAAFTELEQRHTRGKIVLLP